jgi:hypothetical protein
MNTANPETTGRHRVVAPARRSAELTLSVPEAGKRYFGLSRGASYSAAAKGELPTIRIGRLLRVPVRALEAMLDNA